MSTTRYTKTRVLDASRERISYIFDQFENIIVSISGGKDSTVLAHLALMEAKRRNRKIGLFFLDEEVVYQATVDQVEYLMSLCPANTIRYWLQIPFNLTNSTSFEDGQVQCWQSEARKKWLHKRSEKNILHQPWSHDTVIADKNKGFGFYDVFHNFELAKPNTAHLVGLRAVESPNRWRAMVNSKGYKDTYWSTKRKNGSYTFYPIYDWIVSDIWKYIYDNQLKYHRYYDFAFKKGVHPHSMRVSSLTHEKSFKAIQDLPEFEFKTYEKLLARIKGIAFAQETAKNKKMFKVQQLPKNYRTWREYRDFLLATYPDEYKKHIFVKRFERHLENEYVARQQCRQLVLNDYENNLPVQNKEDPVIERVNYWKSVL